jgi:hypothetical protein
MTDDLPDGRTGDGPDVRSTIGRLKDWWWLYCILGYLAGGASIGFTKFTVYYLAEQGSIASLDTLNGTAKLMAERLGRIDDRLLNFDKTMTSQQFTNIATGRELQNLGEHVHALDARADTDRTAIADILTVLATQKEQLATQKEKIGFLLDPKGGVTVSRR